MMPELCSHQSFNRLNKSHFISRQTSSVFNFDTFISTRFNPNNLDAMSPCSEQQLVAPWSVTLCTLFGRLRCEAPLPIVSTLRTPSSLSSEPHVVSAKSRTISSHIRWSISLPFRFRSVICLVGAIRFHDRISPRPAAAIGPSTEFNRRNQPTTRANTQRSYASRTPHIIAPPARLAHSTSTTSFRSRSQLHSSSTSSLVPHSAESCRPSYHSSGPPHLPPQRHRRQP
jgi:hypothetical protein